MARLRKIPELYGKCFPLSKYAHMSGHTVCLNVPPADEGSYFITEDDIAIKICNNFPHVLTEKGWQSAPYFLDLWRDDMTVFVEIQEQFIKDLRLDKVLVTPGTYPIDP